MKKLLCYCHSRNVYRESICSSLSIRPYLFWNTLLVVVCFLWGKPGKAQDISLRNPSLEGVAGQGKVPPSWITAMNTPDTQPGIFDIAVPASDGNTYIGLHSGPLWPEGIAQELSLKGGRSYTVSMDLAFASFYAYRACYGNMAIYAGNAPGDTAELLWRSGPFYHTDWKRYNAVFNPSKDYKYISFWADAGIPCDRSDYGSVILMDNLSAFIREIPQIIISTVRTCKGAANGEATVKVVSGATSCTYRWEPGGQTSTHVEGLAAGRYEVTVTAPNGTGTRAQVTIEETDLKNELVIRPSLCHGDNQIELTLNTTGGIPPYRYYFNGSLHPSYSGVFKELHPGNYNVIVKDDHGCEDKLSQIPLKEPDPLQIITVNVKALSCSDTKDGRISLDIAGGVVPYSFSLQPGSWQNSNEWRQLDAGRYYFEVKDKNGCHVNGNTEVLRNDRTCAVYVPTAFSPNGDGVNDLFRAKINDDVSAFRMTVYNRWGAVVFDSTNPEAGWNGAREPNGSYVWVVIYTDSKNQARKQTGTLVLIR
ncbi:gliding motility-associated C-terminal domain-containing protein [Chitinophaga qingshengii]|uniref:Gliding motility-associated C-terminal domain-containing protein n=1 Tax=Chitinophaga qingshengii TaxID=1569794 RepID=A0ABR7TWH4_9BACT|nr:gliding motility-associated C-terminal domain-containing protein [Chitinophaga qingshengii]MBC9934353.1 gliding motility-associated C-terminal domain-containing protein [Chitinophaga qingshengii]